MKLYVWEPTSHGPRSFIITAESEEAARRAVEQHIEATYPRTAWGQRPSEASGWPDGWVLTIYEPGHVAEHWND